VLLLQVVGWQKFPRTILLWLAVVVEQDHTGQEPERAGIGREARFLSLQVSLSLSPWEVEAQEELLRQELEPKEMIQYSTPPQVPAEARLRQRLLAAQPWEPVDQAQVELAEILLELETKEVILRLKVTREEPASIQHPTTPQAVAEDQVQQV